MFGYDNMAPQLPKGLIHRTFAEFVTDNSASLILLKCIPISVGVWRSGICSPPVGQKFHLGVLQKKE